VAGEDERREQRVRHRSLVKAARQDADERADGEREGERVCCTAMAPGVAVADAEGEADDVGVGKQG
jgi:hypothetical protein